MSVNIRYPNITGFSEKEQIAQIKSYLHQLVEQLNYVFPNLASGAAATSTDTYEVQGVEVSYYDLKSLVMLELQKVENLFDSLSKEIENKYISIDELDNIADQVMGRVSFSIDENGDLYYEVEE